MRILFVFLAFSFALQNFSSAQTPAEKPRHFIFFIHGIGGNLESFGSMPNLLTKELDTSEAKYSHESFIFVYPTNDPTLDSDDFALSFADFLNSKLEKIIRPQDKISIISHSQGGLVATIWLFHASLLQKEFYPKYTDKLDAFITLGTPYWGSKIATIATEDNFLTEHFSSIVKSVLSKLGKRQLQEMSFSSATTLRFRNNMAHVPANILEHIRKKIRPLNIAGMANLSSYFYQATYGLSSGLSVLKAYAFGGKNFESDTCVSIPSARFDSIYTLENSPTYQTNFSPLLVVNSIHASPRPEEVYDLAYVPASCSQLDTCKHPTYKYVLDFILGKKMPLSAPGVPFDELSGFTLSVRVNFPFASPKQQDVKVELISSSSDIKNIVMANKKELLSEHESFVDDPAKSISSEYLHFTGHFTDLKNLKDGAIVTLKIKGPKTETKYIQTRIAPILSTFVEVSLQPKIFSMSASPEVQP
jgi:hypothetical protein